MMLLADRLPGYAERSRVAGAAGVASTAQLTGDPEAVWASIVERSALSGTLPELLRAASRARPGDERLRRAAAGAAEGQLVLSRAAPPVWIVVAAGVLLGGLGWWTLRGDTEAAAIAAVSAEAEAPDAPAVEDASDAPSEIDSKDADALAAAAEKTGETGAEAKERRAARRDSERRAAQPTSAAPEAAGSDVEAGVAADLSTAATVAPESADTSSERCAAGRGELVGYWYTTLSLSEGQVHTLTHGVNVRTDYPRQDNSWSSRAPVTCVLKPGDRVTVASAPVEVGSGHRWVPLRGGDLKPR